MLMTMREILDTASKENLCSGRARIYELNIELMQQTKNEFASDS